MEQALTKHFSKRNRKIDNKFKMRERQVWRANVKNQSDAINKHGPQTLGSASDFTKMPATETISEKQLSRKLRDLKKYKQR